MKPRSLFLYAQRTDLFCLIFFLDMMKCKFTMTSLACWSPTTTKKLRFFSCTALSMSAPMRESLYAQLARPGTYFSDKSSYICLRDIFSAPFERSMIGMHCRKSYSPSWTFGTNFPKFWRSKHFLPGGVVYVDLRGGVSTETSPRASPKSTVANGGDFAIRMARWAKFSANLTDPNP